MRAALDLLFVKPSSLKVKKWNLNTRWDHPRFSPAPSKSSDAPRQIKEMLAERKETLKYIQELQERADTLESREAERYDQMKKKQQLELKTMKELHKAQTKQLAELLAPPLGFVPPK